MSPPKLLHVFPTFEPGGTQLRMCSILNALGDQYRHEILAVDGNYQAASRLAPGLERRLLEPPPRSGPLGYPLALRRLVKASAPDLLLTYNWGAMDAVIGSCWWGPCPIVHNECGFSDEEAFRFKYRRVLARRILLRRVYLTVLVSSRLRELAARVFRLPPSKLRFIRTGVDTRRFRPGRNPELRARLGAAPEDLLFGYVGGLRPEKNLGLLLRAFAAARVERARLALVGDGPMRGELKELAGGLGILPAVCFAGRAEDAAPYWNALDVFLLSSNTEQTSNALLEAMASGLPAAATRVGDNAEVLDPRQSELLTPPGDVDAFREAVRRLASDAALRRELGAANRRRCESLYSFEGMVKGYDAVYREALAAA